MFNSCAFPPPHGMGGSERLSSGARVGTSLPSPVLLGTRQPRRGEAAPAEPAAGLGQSRAGQGRGQLCVLRGSALRPPRHLQVDREGCAAPGWDCRTCSFRLKTAGWADCLRGGRHLGQSPRGSSFWPKPGKGRAPARLSSPGQRPSCGCSYRPRFQAEGSAQAAHMVRLTSWPGPPAQGHGAAPDTLPPSLATPTPVPTPGLCPGRCSARSVLPPPSHRSPPTCPRSGSRGDACPRDAQITAAACIPGTLPTAGRGRCAL